MTSNSGKEPEAVRLSDDAAAMLLARASQLDAAAADQTSIAELRQAARNAGIAPEAFEQALSEFHAANAVAAPNPPPPRRRWVSKFVVATFLILAALVFFSRLIVPPHLT
jgi:membrane-bound lytic murein transglycosylase B